MPTTSVSVTTPAANAANANGYMQADGFFSPATLGQPIDPTTGGHSHGPALFPYGQTITGFQKNGVQIAAAAGSNSQSGATVVTSSVVIVSTVSATTRAFRLPAASTGLEINIFDDTTTAVKVYPGTNGTIAGTATNGNVVIAARKATLFMARNATHWVTMVGA